MMDFINLVVYASIYIGLVATSFYILSFLSTRAKRKELFEDEELPFVSVLIPAYNEEKSISKTLDSILRSYYPRGKFEVIVIDDGSGDRTLEIARQYRSSRVRVFTKKNGGKATALNFGIAKARGEIIITMDADTFVEPHSMKKMVRHFKNPRVYGVTPAMVIYNPKSLLQRIQHIEYMMGLFLRKAFASVNSIYIMPGAFSAYRKKFFDKYGGYEVGNITEDLELAMRIQFNGYLIENCPEAPAYTIAPAKFKDVLYQRRRWYFGLIKNTWNYRRIISPKYGDLGVFVIPLAWISIMFAVFLTVYLFFKTIFDVKDELLFLHSINFDVGSVISVNVYAIERFLFLFFSNPVFLFIMLFMIMLGFYLYYGARKIGSSAGLVVNLPLFFMFFAVLFGFWWVISIFYAIFYKDVKWRKS